MLVQQRPHSPLRRPTARRFAIFAALVLTPSMLAVASATAGGPEFSGWSTAQKIDEINGNHEDINSASTDGCPIQAPDGLSLYLASNRPGGEGGLDIWVSTRRHRGDPWGAPVNLPVPINSSANDFCPTPIEGHGLFFVSNRSIAGACGFGDIYFSRRNPASGWSQPEHLACAPNGPNSVLDEQGPSFVQGQLYFSRSAPAVAGVSAAVPGELFVSIFTDEGFLPATPIALLNDAAANDIQPNVRKDGREVVFSSNRAGGEGGQDIWSSTRSSVDAPWSEPVNLGSTVNTTWSESRPSFSSDAQQLLFGRVGPALSGEGESGMSDVYVTTRQKNR